MKKTLACLLFFLLLTTMIIRGANGARKEKGQTLNPACQIKITKKDANQKINLQLKVPFKIELFSNPTTGYDWYFDNLNAVPFKIVTAGFIPPKGRLVGAGGTKYWVLKPLKRGQYALSLHYYRVWEGKGKAIERYRVAVNVK